jgi:uncharacterized membrane protein (UPF0127 family)
METKPCRLNPIGEPLVDAPMIDPADPNKLLRVTNAERGTVLADRAKRARHLVARTRGLMGAARLPPGQALLLEGDNAIHTCFMGFPIDVAFLDRHGTVVHLIHQLPPWRVSRIVWQARSVLELPTGVLARTGTGVGDRLTFESIGQ